MITITPSLKSAFNFGIASFQVAGGALHSLSAYALSCYLSHLISPAEESDPLSSLTYLASRQIIPLFVGGFLGLCRSQAITPDILQNEKIEKIAIVSVSILTAKCLSESFTSSPISWKHALALETLKKMFH